MHCKFNFILLIKYIIRFITVFVGLLIAFLAITQGDVIAALKMMALAGIACAIYWVIGWAWRE